MRDERSERDWCRTDACITLSGEGGQRLARLASCTADRAAAVEHILDVHGSGCCSPCRSAVAVEPPPPFAVVPPKVAPRRRI